MERHCELCGARIDDLAQYESNKAALAKSLRYQSIIDVLVNSPRKYDQVFFDHQEELPSPYQGIAHRMRSALQELPGTGRPLQKKWPDITAVKDLGCDIVIEEERRPTQEKVDTDIRTITRCRYLWALGRQFELRRPHLFIVLNDNVNNIPPSVQDNVGHFCRVIVCTVEDFPNKYESYYLPGL